jgi:transposase
MLIQIDSMARVAIRTLGVECRGRFVRIAVIDTRCSEGKLSDHVGAKLIYRAMPNAKVPIGDKGYDSDEFRDALQARKIKACIPPRSNRTAPSSYSKKLYNQRHKIENMFAKLKDWRRIATRYDRCAHTFMSAICIAATIILWINQ